LLVKYIHGSMIHLQLGFMTEKVHFHSELTYIHSWKTYHCDTENKHVLHQFTLHYQKVAE